LFGAIFVEEANGFSLPIARSRFHGPSGHFPDLWVADEPRYSALGELARKTTQHWTSVCLSELASNHSFPCPRLALERTIVRGSPADILGSLKLDQPFELGFRLFRSVLG
jgi:hypothetical protein